MADSTSKVDISQHILPTSATMVGVCVTVIGIVRLIEVNLAIATVIDDVAAVAAVLFLLSTMLSYAGLRTPHDTPRLERCADLVFLGALSLLAMCGVMLAWELGQSPLPPAA